MEAAAEGTGPICAIDGGRATIRLNRPRQHNRIEPADLLAIHDFLATVEDDPAVRVLVFTGTGKTFSSGYHLGALSDRQKTETDDGDSLFSRVVDQLEALRVPTIAALNGGVYGGSTDMALACDFRLAADTARLGQPEILLGIIPGGGGTQRLARLVGPARAKDLVLSGRQVRADEALAIGLVDEVVAPDALMVRALELAGTFARGPLAAQALAKAAIDRGLDTDLASGLRLEQDLFVEVFATDDARLGVASFMEHGPGRATFTGR